MFEDLSFWEKLKVTVTGWDPMAAQETPNVVGVPINQEFPEDKFIFPWELDRIPESSIAQDLGSLVGSFIGFFRSVGFWIVGILVLILLIVIFVR